MSRTNNTLKRKENQYHHLTKDDRAKIQSLIEQKDNNGKRLFSNTYIANYLGVHKSTISRELRKRIIALRSEMQSEEAQFLSNQICRSRWRKIERSDRRIVDEKIRCSDF